MSRRRVIPAIAMTMFIAAACGGGTATTAPSVAAPQSQAPASAASAPAGEASAPASEASAPASAASAAAGACAPSSTAGTVSVKIANFAFDPPTITAKVGDTVTWTNNDSTQHTATVKSDQACTTPKLDSGASSGITFTQAGTYDYMCTIHPTMTGKVEVTS